MMVTQEYICDPDEGGCNFILEQVEQYGQKARKICPQCRKWKLRRILHVAYGRVIGGTSTTLGSLADKNDAKLSQDEKDHLSIKHNEYKHAKDKPLDKWLSDHKMTRVEKKKNKEPWYRSDNSRKIQTSTNAQKERYVKTGKI